ncbi:MAG: RidA family protein [bacterium]
MSKKAVHTNQAPKAVGPYNQGIITDCEDLFFSAGQIGLDPKKNSLISSSFKLQAEQALKNLQAVLTEAGSSLDEVVKVTVYLKNIDDFNEFNKIYATFFKHNPPARSAIEVAALPKNALIEIECIACITE